MNKIQPLFGDRLATPANEPCQEVVSFVEELLARAKCGDVRAIAVAFIRGNGNSAEGWEQDADPRLTRDLHSAAVSMVHNYTVDMNCGAHVPLKEST